MQNFNKILLGKLKTDAGTFADGENVWLEKHSWDCGWYWGFGCIGNKNCHFHFDSLLCINDGKGSVKYCASDLFESTNISDSDWWIIRDLFAQAYALRKAAEVYQRTLYHPIKNKERADQINADLAKVLDAVWDLACAAVNKAATVEV
jgi:hypothetical protein